MIPAAYALAGASIVMAGCYRSDPTAPAGSTIARHVAIPEARRASAPPPARAPSESQPTKRVDTLECCNLCTCGKQTAPAGLDKNEIVAGMLKIKPLVAACYKRVGGTAMIATTIGKDGGVTRAATNGPLADTEEGHCVEAAVKKAQFPPLRDGANELSFTYPFVLH